jgi:S1-C subfamily serine protease
MQPARLSSKVRESLRLENEIGVLIAGVEADGPADKAGVMIGDVLVALDGKAINGLRGVQSCLIGGQVGKTLKASMIRGGALIEVAITLGERPAAT